jgi:hypothetical protein
VGGEGEVSTATTGTGPVIETKVAAGSAATVVVGLLTWALTTFIPSWHSGIPADLLPFIPVAAGWLTGSVAGYFAPHTHRPDLGQLITGELVTVEHAAEAVASQAAQAQALPGVPGPAKDGPPPAPPAGAA